MKAATESPPTTSPSPVPRSKLDPSGRRWAIAAVVLLADLAVVLFKLTGARHTWFAPVGLVANAALLRVARFASRVEPVRAVFTRWCRALDPDPVLPGPAGSAWADAIAAVTAAGQAFMTRFRIVEVPLWQVAVAVSAARLMAPGWPGSNDRD